MRLKAIQIYSFLFSLMCVGGYAFSAAAETATISVASNFVSTAQKLVSAFEDQFNHSIKVASGSSGKIVTQIIHGAPFDVFLAADLSYPQVLIDKDLAQQKDIYTYAIGKLVMFSNQLDVEEGGLRLDNTKVKRIAIASPDLAPYGKAAVEFLQIRKLLSGVKSKLVYGNNIAQAYQFVATGNAHVGFVALSQMQNQPKKSYWVVPPELYSPLKQGAVLLKKGSNNQAAQDFFKFLKSDEAHALIRRSGYEVAGE